jgi:hypothetical protein
MVVRPESWKAWVPIRVTVFGTKAEVRPEALKNASFAISVIPLGISARPVHEVLVVTTFELTVKDPLVLHAIVPLGTANAGAGEIKRDVMTVKAEAIQTLENNLRLPVIINVLPCLLIRFINEFGKKAHSKQVA